MKVIQPPIKNESFTGERVLAHSGEFSPKYTDVVILGRSLDFRFDRTYRSSQSETLGLIGYGWTFNYERRLVTSGKDIIYFDGEGRSLLFKIGNGDSYISPKGMYCKLVKEKTQFVQNFRFGIKQVFELPENGGRIISIQDRNENAISFRYSENEIILTDSLNRTITLHLTKNLITHLEDFTGRLWQLKYDSQKCLVEVMQPGTRDFPKGTSLRYKYDENKRLVALLNARGKTFLKNYYDKKTGRVTAQDHGNGAYKFNYKKIKSAGETIVLETQTILKNGAVQSQLHNETGNEIKRILLVSANSFAPEEKVIQKKGFVSLITLSEYNQHGELTRRIFPAGNSSEWIYSTKNTSSKDQGNLIQQKYISSVKTDKPLVTSYEYSKDFQLLLSETNPKGQKDIYTYDANGNLINKSFAKVIVQTIDKNGKTKKGKTRIKKLSENYEYNTFGQLIKKTNTDGTLQVYYYYPENDPLGEKQKGFDDLTNQGGFLSGIVKDANGIKQIYGLRYDIYGNIAVRTDAKSNEFQQKHNAMGKVETSIGRKPDTNIIEFHFDEEYNVISETKAFDHYILDNKQQNLVLTSSKNIAIYAYNDLNNLVSRTFGDGNKMITETYVLDANENLVQFIQPMGNVTEYKYDECNLLVEKISGFGSKQPSSYKCGYAKSGQLKKQTDPGGNETLFNYDGYQREIGFINPIGTSVKKVLDDNGNVVKIQTWGFEDDGPASKGGKPILVEERTYQLDEWNRVFKINEKCFDSKPGEALSKSDWDNAKGIASSVVVYGDNNLPVTIWKENNNIVSIDYDGLGRKSSICLATGLKVQLEYDENNNITRRIESGNDGKNAIIVENKYDEADRLISQKKNNENAKSWAYNAANKVIKTIEKSGIEISYLHDSLGRAIGNLYKTGSGTGDEQLIIRTRQYNDNFQLTAYTNAVGLETTYQYDDNGRVISKINENEDLYQYIYDERSNLKAVTTPEDNRVSHSYDAIGRIEKRIFAGNSKKEESFKYDSKNRLVAAVSEKAKMTWVYDSLSRMIIQTQNEKTVGFTHDDAGNLTSISYPGGKTLQYSYDEAGRVTAISDNLQPTIAIYQYNALGQFDGIIYYNGSRADFKYDEQQRLESLTFTDTGNKKLLDGCRYGYDAAGRVIFEVHLYQGKDKGDRYYYDDVDRLIKAQYGVDKVSDINSAFEKEILFTYTPEGLWADKTTLDCKGNILKKETGIANKLNNYATLGSIAYAYNKEGNCLLEARCIEFTELENKINWTEKEISNLDTLLTYWTYEYDEHMRMSKAVQHDHDGNILMTIEYYYDTSGHLIERIETDGSGVKTDYTYVYAGDMLIEEYTDGKLAKQYTYGPTLDIPIKTDFFDNGKWQESLNFFDGRQNITSIIDGLTNDARQRFGFDGLGSGHIFEVNGITISPNDPVSNLSNSLNSLFHGLGNAGQGMAGSFGDAMSMFTDVISGRDMLNGRAHNAQNGHTANQGNYGAHGERAGGESKYNVYEGVSGSRLMGVRNWGLIADEKEETSPVNSAAQTTGTALITAGVAVATESVLTFAGASLIALALTGTAAYKWGKIINNISNDIISFLSGDKYTSAGVPIYDALDSMYEHSRSSSFVIVPPNEKLYSNPDADSGGSVIDPKIIEAKLFGNITPINPGLSGFIITPDSIETPEKRRNMIALYGGNDPDGGNGNSSDILDSNGNLLDPDRFITNYGNGLPEGPDFTNFPGPGCLNS